MALLFPTTARAVMEQVGNGTGFFVTADGYFVTNHHVVDGAQAIEVKCKDKKFPAVVVKLDPKNDVAILKIEGSFESLALGDDAGARPGDDVFTIGFPMAQLMGEAPKTTIGSISALSGVQDDARMFQTSVQIQPGNSGGPLVFKDNGNVIGITSASLARESQNVNYAMKAGYIRPLLPRAALEKLTPARGNRPFRQIQQEVENSVGLVLIFKEADEQRAVAPKPAPEGGKAVPANIQLISKVSVSSVLTPQKTKAEGAILYAPRNLFDGLQNTAWVEGVQGTGVGEWIEIEFTKAVALTTLKIFAGYGKNSEIYAKNGRVKKFKLSLDGGKTFGLECEDQMSFNRFTLPEAEVVRVIRLQIVEVYPGQKYSDTAVSEIEFE